VSIESERPSVDQLANLEGDYGLPELHGPPPVVEAGRIARWNVFHAVMGVYQARVMAIHERSMFGEISGVERDRLTTFYREAVEHRMAGMNEPDVWIDLMEQDPEDIVDGWLFG
jgi:hypothetical protein